MVYEYIRTLTIRGSKVKKIIKMIKTYELLFGEPQFPLSDLSDELEEKRKELEIQYYSLNDCTKNIKEFIDDIFERKEYEKGEFKKKAFSGSKIIAVLKYIDQQILRSKRNLNDLECYHPLTVEEQISVFNIYWSQQLESLQLIKNLILSQYVTLRNEETYFIQNILLDLVEED